MITDQFAEEVKSGKRFEFGKNWSQFLSVLDDERIATAVASLQTMLEVEDLKGRDFLDVGNGSGLFSLAAMHLGAERVHSFDYDPNSVACAEELKRRFYPNGVNWRIERGSALDADFLRGLGKWDVVYSWGVLHHTGKMWDAIDLVSNLVKSGGLLFISIYNDQGGASRRWKLIKKLYCRGNPWKMFIFVLVAVFWIVRGVLIDMIRGKNPMKRYSEKRKSRGMSVVYDWYDWFGGYPFEVAKPDAIFDFLKARGFTLLKVITCGSGRGCNEFVFKRMSI